VQAVPDLAVLASTDLMQAEPGAKAHALQNGLVATRTFYRVLPDQPLARIDRQPDGAYHCKIGDVIEEVDDLQTFEDRTNIALHLPLAAGMEPLNPALATAPAEATPSAPPTVPPAYVRFGDDEALNAWLAFSRGTATLRMRMRAAFPGVFTAPAAWAEALYNPGVMGASAGPQLWSRSKTRMLFLEKKRNLLGRSQKTVSTRDSGRCILRNKSPLLLFFRKEGLPFPIQATRAAIILACCLFLVWAYDVAQDAHLAAPDPTPVILDRDGAFITQAGHVSAASHIEYGYWIVPPPPRVVAATLVLADRRFWSHPGVDPIAILRALATHLFGGESPGASTIAMQVARMQHPRARTIWAKTIEAGVAVAITARYGHQAVLAQYLRLAPYGDSSHGIGHAAWWYFGRPAADLDWGQAALLAAIPQSPSWLALDRANLRTVQRARTALLRVARGGNEQAAAAEPILADTQKLPRPRRPPFTQLVLRLQARARALPPSNVPPLHATIDLPLQTAVAATLASQMGDWRNFGAQQAALMVVQQKTGAVLACIGAVPKNPGSGLDFSATDRSPGSALKPFLYALAFDRNLIAPDGILFDQPEQAYGIANADHDFLGPLLPRQALANSRNVPAAALLRHLTVEAGFSFLRDVGLHDLGVPASRFGLGIAIGAVPTRLDRLVRAYHALANDGVWQDLVWFREQQPSPRKQVFSLPTARLVSRFLSDPMARLPSFQRYGTSEYPLAVALKTGTSQGYRDAWTVAWSDTFLVGAWVGRPDAAPMAQVSGARSAAALVQSVLLGLRGLGRTDLVAGDFAAPPDRSPAELCARTGRTGPCENRQPEFVTARTTAAPLAEAPPRLAVVAPPTGTHFWRNPELPSRLNKLALHAAIARGVQQVTWLVDGVPTQTASPYTPFLWPMLPGRHSFQIRLPLAPDISAPVALTVD
jgi:penicillin-binding protein 1C